jgi:thioredoxin-related protein
MRILNRLIVSLVALALLAGAAPATRDAMEHFFHPFLGDLREELADAKAGGRKGMLIMYHFEECPACTKMKQTVLNQPVVQDWYRSTFRVVAIDTRGAQPITGLDGRTLPESEYARALQIRGTPTFDFYAPDGARAYRHVGGLYSVDEFLLLGQFVASGAHRTQTFAEFRKAQAQKGS